MPPPPPPASAQQKTLLPQPNAESKGGVGKIYMGTKENEGKEKLAQIDK
jgi:hypothetical protein